MIQYWVPAHKVNPGVFIAIFYVLIILINLLGIKVFGEVEFWLSSLKVITIVGVILLSLILACGGGPTHDATGFRYWHNPGAFKAQYKTGATGQFLGFWSCMVNAVFAFLGTELVGVTCAEAQNPRRTIPRAIRLTFFRILFFYVLSVFLVGMLVPYNSKQLAFATSATTGANASPFVVAIKLARIPVLDHILNACILIFTLSASNSDLYVATRTLYGLACDDSAPAIFKRTTKSGLPIFAMIPPCIITLIAFLNVSDDSRKIFIYFVNLVTILGLMSWISILITHIHFVRARRAQRITNDQMPYVAPFGLIGSYIALAICILVAVTKNYGVFIHNKKTYGNFDYKTFITAYLGIPLWVGCYIGHKLITKSKKVTPEACDLFTGKEIIDREEEEFLAAKAEHDAVNPPSGFKKFYMRFVSWLL